MLDYARENRSVLGNVSFQQADAQALDYADNAFDALVCQFGVMFFPDKARAMSEFARVLRPGGLLAFNVWGSLAENRVAEIAQTTIESFFESDPPDFLRVPFGFSDPEPIQQLLQDAGFHDHQFEIVEETIECADAVSIARGFVEGNPGILQIRERAICDPEDVVQAVAGAIEAEYGPAPLQIPLREIVILARKP
jgi:SAM-dependent methyltransferase